MSTESDNIEALRLQLIENGYWPIPNLDKRTFMKDWPRIRATPELIHDWKRKQRRMAATGLLVLDGLAVIDIDVDDPAMVEQIAAAIDGVVPGLGAQALIRFGKGAKEAWYVRTSEQFSRIHTRRWHPAGASLDAGAHCVECFGGLAPRQFGSFGAHTVDDAGEVVVRYEWADDVSPATTPLGDLPQLDKRQFHELIDRIEAVFAAAGWEAVQRSTKGEGNATRVYDLSDDMSFDLNDGRRLSLSELREAARSDDGLRCTAGWLEGEQAGMRTDRCIIGTTRAGTLTVWESASGITHLPADAKPKDFRLDLDRVTERLKELKDKRRFKVSSEDDAVTAAAKLLQTYAYCPKQAASVIPIWTNDLLDGIQLAAFRTLMLPNCSEDVGPRGGRVVINPVDIWSKDSNRITVAGVRMRPDKPRPTFEDGGQLWINAYAPPSLPSEGGDATLGIEFIAQLLPDELERQWFLQWLAFKRQRPDIPGPAVVMVAREFGTGRGTLGELVKRLFGRQYVATIPFAIFAGRSSQAQYTDWGASSLMVLVNESSEQSEAGSRYSVKRDTYEHLKELIDPRAIERTYIAKGRQAFKAVSHSSYIIATNNMDALPIPANDRRFAVLSNGEPVKDVAYWEALNAWMDDPENVGAFARFLDEEVDLSGYSPFAAPIETTGKRDMTEAAKSDLDGGMEHALAGLASKVFVPEQIIRALREAQRTYGLEYPDKWQVLARRMIQSKSYRVGVKHGDNWWLHWENKRYPVYALTQAAAAASTRGTSAELRKRVLENGDPKDVGDTLSVLSKR